MTLWLVLVVLLCAEAKTPAEDVVVELGQNVTLNCSVDVFKTFWFMKVHSGFQSCISRNMDKDGRVIYYYVFNHANKFLIQGNKLQVLNITSQDQRVYCCGEKPQGNTVQCKDTYRLKTSTDHQNQNQTQTQTQSQNQNQTQTQSQTQNQTQSWVLWTSLSLNAILIVVVTGLVLKLLCLKTQTSTHEPSALTSHSPDTLDAAQYEEIILPEYRNPPPDSRPSECIYYKAQLPRPSH